MCTLVSLNNNKLERVQLLTNYNISRDYTIFFITLINTYKLLEENNNKFVHSTSLLII
jgi:hypothetical protein